MRSRRDEEVIVRICYNVGNRKTFKEKTNTMIWSEARKYIINEYIAMFDSPKFKHSNIETLKEHLKCLCDLLYHNRPGVSAKTKRYIIKSLNDRDKIQKYVWDLLLLSEGLSVDAR